MITVCARKDTQGLTVDNVSKTYLQVSYMLNYVDKRLDRYVDKKNAGISADGLILFGCQGCGIFTDVQ